MISKLKGLEQQSLLFSLTSFSGSGTQWRHSNDSTSLLHVATARKPEGSGLQLSEGFTGSEDLLLR